MPVSNRQTDLEGLRGDVLKAEMAIIDLNRRLTTAIVCKRATGCLSSELNEMIGTRDFMVERLKRLKGASV
jgi:hypothetical protein